MIECLLVQPYKPNAPIIPNSGPGPTSLIDGTLDLGYFGEVNNTDFFTTSAIELKAKVQLIGNVVNRDIPRLWLKYAFNGKIIYIPKRVQRTAISWDNLYAAGFVYGVDGPGTYPSTVSGPVNQLSVISLTDSLGKVWNFKIRLVHQATVDPAPSFAGGPSEPTVVNSEWSNTVERTWPTDGISKIWGVFGNIGGASAGIESRITFTQYCSAAGGNSSAYFRSMPLKNGVNTSWLPCLELIPDP